jgi:hypothetical protein
LLPADPTGVTAHVGRTTHGKKGLNNRLRNHWDGSSSFSEAYLHGDGLKLHDGYAFQLLPVEPRLRVLLEYAATVELLPAHLGTREKADSIEETALAVRRRRLAFAA